MDLFGLRSYVDSTASFSAGSKSWRLVLMSRVSYSGEVEDFRARCTGGLMMKLGWVQA